MSKRKVPTIASDVIKNHDSTPLFAWIRDFFLGVKRSPVTPPPGIPGPDGKVVYQNPNRFANNQSSRNVEPALAQGGVHHKIADNYYYERDGRRMVLPPTPIYKVLEEGKPKLMTPRGEELAPEKLNEVKGMMIGHEQNYGFSPRVPTPGFGYEWNRNIGNEEPSQQVDSELARVQIYDKYMKADRK